MVLLGSESKPRERTPEAKKGAAPDPRGALRLDQGRSSKEGGKVGDKDLVGSGMCTLQIHWIQVKDGLGNKVVTCPGLALHSVREHDAFGAS